MEHAQREAALRAGDLVVIELHRIDGPAAKFVVLRIRTEDRTQQNASVTSLGVSFHRFDTCEDSARQRLCAVMSDHITKILRAISTCPSVPTSGKPRDEGYPHSGGVKGRGQECPGHTEPALHEPAVTLGCTCFF